VRAPSCSPKTQNLAAIYEAKSYPIYVVIDRDGDIAAFSVLPPEKMRYATCCIEAAWEKVPRLRSNLSTFSHKICYLPSLIIRK
jgi:hypothetical protein